MPCSVSAKNKIAEVVPEKLPVPPVKGGAIEKYVYETCLRLQDKYNITVFSRPSFTEPKDQIEYHSIPFSHIENQCDSIILNYKKRNPIRVAAKILIVLLYGYRVAVNLKGFHWIHIHNEPNLIPIIRLFNKRAKILLHMHNSHLAVKPVFQKRYHRILQQVEKVICVSDYIKEEIRCAYPGIHFETIYNGVNESLFKNYGETINAQVKKKYDIKGPLILFAGRLIKEKGPDLLIQAFHQVLKKQPEAKLILAGSHSWYGSQKKADDSYYQKLLSLSKNIAPHIIFTGHLTGEDYYHLYSAADIVVCPSRWNEPFGLVCIEGMASESAVIASKCGAFPEIITDGHDGFLVEPDIQQIADKLNYVINNEQKLKTVAQAARKTTLKKFTWDMVSRNLSKTITQ